MKRVYAALLALAALGFGFVGLPRLLQHMSKYPQDGLADWKGARLFFSGHSPYTPEGLLEMGMSTFGHPPTTPFWFLPLAHLPLAHFSTVLGCIVLVVLLVHLVIVARELRLPRPELHAVLVFAVVLCTPWMAAHAEAAQVSELIAFFYVLAWYHLRRGRDLPAGIALGLATTFKLFPALVILFFLFARRWRVVLGALGAYLAVALIMTTSYGWKSWYLFLTLQGPTADLWISRLENGSLWGIVARIFYPGCGMPGPVQPHITLIVGLWGAALVGFVWRVSRKALTTGRDLDLPYALITLVSLFLNPWLWEHYFVFYLLPLAMIAATLVRGWSTLRRGERLVVGVCLLLAIGFMRFPTGIEAFKGLRNAWKLRQPWSHLRLHGLEVMHWSIGPLLQVALFALLRAGCGITPGHAPCSPLARPSGSADGGPGAARAA